MHFFHLKTFVKERKDTPATSICTDEMIYRAIVKTIRKKFDISEPEIRQLIVKQLKTIINNQ